MHYGKMRLKLRSMSEGDLKSIAKRMIGGALNDREQMAKLHRAIYEELYFQCQEKFEESYIDRKLINVWSQKEPVAQNPSSDDESKQCVGGNAVRSIEKNRDSLPSGRSENSAVQNANLKNRTKKSVTIKLSGQSLIEVGQKNNEAFSIWKREKNKTLKRIWKEARIKKQEQLATQQNEYEKRRASYEAYKRSKKIQESQRKVKKLQKKIIKDDCLLMLEQANEKIVANEGAFRFWKKRKNDGSRQQSQQRRQVPISNNHSAFEFEAWLNRLDLVLHQKYMRERRYLVRSFYCQPVYFGSAALCMS